MPVNRYMICWPRDASLTDQQIADHIVSVLRSTQLEAWNEVNKGDRYVKYAGKVVTKNPCLLCGIYGHYEFQCPSIGGKLP